MCRSSNSETTIVAGVALVASLLALATCDMMRDTAAVGDENRRVCREAHYKKIELESCKESKK